MFVEVEPEIAVTKTELVPNESYRFDALADPISGDDSILVLVKGDSSASSKPEIAWESRVLGFKLHGRTRAGSIMTAPSEAGTYTFLLFDSSSSITGGAVRATTVIHVTPQ